MSSVLPKCSFVAKAWVGVVAAPWRTLDLPNTACEGKAGAQPSSAACWGFGGVLRCGPKLARFGPAPPMSGPSQLTWPKRKDGCEQTAHDGPGIMTGLLTHVLEMWARCSQHQDG